MIPVTKIIITRAEGPCDLCGKPKTFKTFEGASAWLNRQGYTFPKTGGYDKHDFTVIWADGETYNGRLDCKHPDCDDNDLDVFGHMLSFLEWNAGRTKNPWCGMDKYRSIVSGYPEADREEAGLFIDTYLGGMK